MEFLKGNNTFNFGKLKLGSVNINRIYLGSNYVWPPLANLSCAIEGSAQGTVPLFSCAIEGSAQGTIPLFSCAIEGSAIINDEIIIDGLTYKMVTNPITGRTWLDRNLGATEVAQDVDWVAARGWLYQWGRPTDGHQLINSSTTFEKSSTDVPDTSSFINSTSSFNYDWRSPQNDNLWQGANGINNPGVNGFRLPTRQEWEAEMATWVTQDVYGAFDSPLKLPITKFRREVDGDIVEILNGYYWSSDVDGIFATHMRSRTDGITYGTSRRASGMAVRLILDEV